MVKNMGFLVGAKKVDSLPIERMYTGREFQVFIFYLFRLLQQLALPYKP